MWAETLSNRVQIVATAYFSELRLRSDHVMRGHVFSNCVVSGRKVTMEADLDDMPGSASGCNKIILLREEFVYGFTRSSGSCATADS